MQCKCRTKLKVRCKRAAKADSDYCTQHTNIGCAVRANSANTNTNTKATKTNSKKATSKKAKANAANILTLQNQKNDTSDKLYKVTATLHVDTERPVSARELYQYVISEGGNKIKRLVEHLALYQFRYNTKAHSLQLVGNECVLSFILSVKEDSPYMDRRYRDDNMRWRVKPMLKFIQEDIASTARDFGDACYESTVADECHYPFPDGSMSEIQVKNVQIGFLRKSLPKSAF